MKQRLYGKRSFRLMHVLFNRIERRGRKPIFGFRGGQPEVIGFVMSKNKDAIDDMRFADFLSDIVAKFDPQLRHTYVNSAVEHFTGLKSEDFLGRTNRELGMPADLVNRWDDVLGQGRFQVPSATGRMRFDQ